MTTSESSDPKVAKQKEMVGKMRNASAAMTATLARIEEIENHMENVCRVLKSIEPNLGEICIPSNFIYNHRRAVHEFSSTKEIVSLREMVQRLRAGIESKL